MYAEILLLISITSLVPKLPGTLDQTGTRVCHACLRARIDRAPSRIELRNIQKRDSEPSTAEVEEYSQLHFEDQVGFWCIPIWRRDASAFAAFPQRCY
jgi:hypothetical protein